MAGGVWSSANKALPGVYINTKSQGRVSVNVGERGTVAIAKGLSWGPSGIVREIPAGEDVTPYIGYDITSDQALFLREMMKGSDTTPGPSKILLYRPIGTGGVKAEVAIGSLTVTALYEGVRGNDITIMVQEKADMTGVYEVSTIVDGRSVDDQAVSKLDDLKKNDWVSFAGSGEVATQTAGTPLKNGMDPTVETKDYADFLEVLEPYRFDVLIYDGKDEVVIQSVAAFVKRISQHTGKKCQAVMSGANTADSEFVISVNNGVILEDGTALSPAQATWWVGGAEAGAPYNKSLTYAKYPGAREANPKRTDPQAEKAVKSGQFCFIDSFGTVRVCMDINSLITFTVDKGQEFSKNRVLRVLMQFCNDVQEYFEASFIGKTDNNESGRALLKGWIVGYLNEMQANNGIQNFTAEDVEVLQGSTLEAVLVNVKIQPVDSVEKIYMTVTVSVNAQTE